MAPTESTDKSPFAHKPTEDDRKPKEAEPETVQKHSADPAITKILQFTVSGSDQLSDPAIEETFRAISELGLNVVDVSGTYEVVGAEVW